MVQFLNATQTFGEIQSIINQATNRSSIVMISPYIKVNDLILSRLIDAGRNRNVRITMICRENDLKADERARLEQIPNLILVCDEHVHAKCFFNDECMVIGSLNLYDSTAGINHEMGVLLRNDHEGDKEAFQAAKNEAQFIIRNAQTPHEQKLELEPKIKGEPEISQKPNGSKNKEP
jgi:phosphatidylserine/phosphatidylglycerophosphate/cardiolipin synthase-like enzyme